MAFQKFKCIRRYSMASFLLIVVSAGSLMAQRTITGTVSASEDGTPLIGATVMVVGSSTGTITDVNGEYSIDVLSDADALSFRYVGYITKDIAVGAQTSINVSLDQDISQVEEVVVIGYAVQKKKDLTGAISVVSSDDIAKANANSLSKALQGRAAGVTIMSTSGQPGADMNIRIRGVGSINNDAQPLVVIDGIITGTSTLNGLNPQDIESISVLKDAAAAAIYGAQSSNGVILVETKKGKSGALKVQFSTQVGVSNIPRRMDIMNSDEYISYYEQAYAAHNARFTDPTQKKLIPLAYSDSARAIYGNNYTDWQDLIAVENALNQNYHLGISGGTDVATYMISGTFLTDEGFLLNTNRRSTTFRVNTSFKIGKRITVGENFSFSIGQTRTGGSSDPFLTAVITSPLMPVYNEDAIGGFQGPAEEITGPNERSNPYAELFLNEQSGNGNGMFGNIFGEIEIIKGLTFRTVLGLNYYNYLGTQWSPKYDLVQRSNFTASFGQDVSLTNKLQWDQVLTYVNSFSDHNITILAGHSVEDQLNNSISGNARDFTWENLRTLSNGNPLFATVSQYITPVRGESYFGRFTYDYKGKYLLTGTIRRDGSSKFGPANKWGTFPAFSVGWKLNEDLLRSVEQINQLKLRFGYGKSGNTPDGSFLFDTYLSIYPEHVYTLGSEDAAIFGAAPFYNYGLNSLQWEESIMTNFGLDLTAFRNRLQFSAEYYIKDQVKLLTFLPLQYVYGLSGDANPPMVNLGDLRNRGFEFNVIYKKQEGDFKYSITANLTTVKNTLEYLPQTQQFNSSGTNVAKEGHAIGSYWGYVAERILQVSDFLTDDNGNLIVTEEGQYIPLVPFQEDFTGPGDIKYKDLNHDGKITPSDQTIIGKPIPDFSYGAAFDFQYRSFDLNLHFQGVQNMDLYNQFQSRGGLASGDVTTKDENKLRIVNDYWTPENPMDDQTGISLTDYNRNNRISTWWVEDASFLRLRNLQLGYTLPANLVNSVGISNLRIYIGGENLFVITKYRGYDPEVSNQDPLGGNSGLVDTGAYPIPKIYTVGLSVNF